LLFFFLGFVVAAQIGGRILDREGAKRAVVLGAAISAVGYGFWASKAMTLSFSQQQLWVIVAGFGMGMLIGPANTDVVNRASSLSYGEATGITQTVRNFGASLGLAALGTTLLFNFRSELTDSFRQRGIPGAVTRANAVTQQQQGGSGTNVASIPHYVAVDFAHATSIVLYVMCGVMAFAGVVALFGLERGRQEETSFEVGEAPSTTSEAV
jgi:MFS family permease